MKCRFVRKSPAGTTFCSLGTQAFQALPDPQLAQRDDDGLLDYIRDARAAGRQAEARRALKHLVAGNIGNVKRRVSMKVRPGAVEDLTQEIMTSAIGAAFVGESVGEFHSWLNTITARRIADHYRDREGDPPLAPLVTEHEGDDEVWGGEPEGLEPDASEVELRLGVSRLLEARNPIHQAVVVMYCYMQWPAARTAQEANARFAPEPPMSENNVQKIGQRFRDDLRRHLGGGDTDG